MSKRNPSARHSLSSVYREPERFPEHPGSRPVLPRTWLLMAGWAATLGTLVFLPLEVLSRGDCELVCEGPRQVAAISAVWIVSLSIGGAATMALVMGNSPVRGFALPVWVVGLALLWMGTLAYVGPR